MCESETWTVSKTQTSILEPQDVQVLKPLLSASLRDNSCSELIRGDFESNWYYEIYGKFNITMEKSLGNVGKYTAAGRDV